MINFDKDYKYFEVIPGVLKELREKAGMTTCQLTKAAGLWRNYSIEDVKATGIIPKDSEELEAISKFFNDIVGRIEIGDGNCIIINEDRMEKIMSALGISKQDFCNLVETEYEKRDEQRRQKDEEVKKLDRFIF